jgi:hypothetical protein
MPKQLGPTFRFTSHDLRQQHSPFPLPLTPPPPLPPPLLPQMALFWRIILYLRGGRGGGNEFPKHRWAYKKEENNFKPKLPVHACTQKSKS